MGLLGVCSVLVQCWACARPCGSSNPPPGCELPRAIGGVPVLGGSLSEILGWGCGAAKILRNGGGGRGEEERAWEGRGFGEEVTPE